MRRHTVVAAPSNLGLAPTGVEELPDHLLAHGLARALDARVVTLTPPPYLAGRDPDTLTLNTAGIRQFSVELADAVGGVLARGEWPVVLGGDCSIVLGTMLGFRRRGRYGLLYVDAHADFYQPEVNPNGQAASMDLAFVTGHGPSALTDLDGRGPLVRAEDTVLFAFRDADEQAAYGSQPTPPELLALDLAAVQRDLDGAVAAARARFAGLDGYVIHVDADVLDDAIMPAVDYRLPGGLSWEAWSRVLALTLPGAAGLELTIYNPRLDTVGAGAELTRRLVAALTGTR